MSMEITEKANAMAQLLDAWKLITAKIEKHYPDADPEIVYELKSTLMNEFLVEYRRDNLKTA